MVFSMAQIDIAFEINYARVQYLALFRVYALSNIELTGTLLYKKVGIRIKHPDGTLKGDNNESLAPPEYKSL
jgi:hypothetical protein